MRYLKFRIQNFKGIKDAEVDLRSSTGVNVFAFVGLNESGKTTILEAISSFSPDYRTRSLRRSASQKDEEAAKDRLPRHLLARFTGEIVVEATIAVSAADKLGIVELIDSEASISVNPTQIPDVFRLCRKDIFERGDYVKTEKTFDFDLNVKRKGDRKEKPLTKDERTNVYYSLWSYTPDIAYYDSFIFDFPKRIYLTARHGSGDWVFRKMFEDVLAAGRIPYTLDDITRRIRSEKYKKSWLDFFTDWSSGDDKDRVQQIFDQASETITEAVFGKWNKIFKEDVRGKEIIVQYGLEKGHTYNKDTKTYSDSDEHDLYVTLDLKDGVQRFPIQDRSLGFRWFFAFLLFTQFRARKGQERPVLFLFDEPAANLHAAAQERLIESFPEIATADNMLLYSTHSHYMISPDWLEQTFIVTNAADSPGVAMVDSAVIKDDDLDIKAELYRHFANDHPSETSYFQPIIDRLEVKPSSFDISLPSVILEGKSDYYILRYASFLYADDNCRLIPGTGSGTFGALIALGAAWGTKFLFLLDADDAGEKEKSRYALDHGVRIEALCTLRDMEPGISEIEDVLDAEAREFIKAKLGSSKLTKRDILRFFQEQLAKREILDLGPSFANSTKKILHGLADRVHEL